MPPMGHRARIQDTSLAQIGLHHVFLEATADPALHGRDGRSWVLLGNCLGKMPHDQLAAAWVRGQDRRRDRASFSVGNKEWGIVTPNSPDRRRCTEVNA